MKHHSYHLPEPAVLPQVCDCNCYECEEARNKLLPDEMPKCQNCGNNKCTCYEEEIINGLKNE